MSNPDTTARPEFDCEICGCELVPVDETVRREAATLARRGYPVICSECEPFTLWRRDLQERRQKAVEPGRVSGAVTESSCPDSANQWQP